MDVETLRTIYRLVLLAAGASSVVVPIVYWHVSDGRWKDSTLGRHLMASDAIIAGIFVFTAIALLTDFPRVELTIGILLFIAFTWLRISRSRYMLHAKRLREAEKKYGITEEEIA